jgi:protein-tyrosine-phosphatase
VVLFVCVHNAGRSQAAAALLDHRAQGRVRVLSAGSEPAASVNPAVAIVLAERGIDIATRVPARLNDEMAQRADVVITMGCGDACPVYPGKQYCDWPVRDPAGLAVDEVRVIVDDIDERVRALLETLVSDR